jgi:hypothetical protein
MRHEDLSIARRRRKRKKRDVVAVADDHVPRCGNLIGNQVINTALN